MARLAGVSARDAGLYTKIVYFFTRRNIAQITGRELDNIIEPLKMYAYIAKLLRGRFNLALGIGAAGFSEGIVCAVPTTISQLIVPVASAAV
jgi:hypothetical protein